jgi:SAM-dependent methyltransferase
MTSLKNIEMSYDRIARKWTTAFADEHAQKRKDREMLHLFAAQLQNRGRVVDIGCGPGNTSGFLADLNVNVTGLDISRNLVGEAKQRFPGIPFVRGDMMALPFGDGALDGIACFYGIVHFTGEQIQRAFRQAYRALNGSGLFLLTFHVGNERIHLAEFMGETVDVDFYLFPSEEIVAQLQAVGFVEMAVIERDPYPDVEYASRRAYVIAQKTQ